jgi:hypothetical protein
MRSGISCALSEAVLDYRRCKYRHKAIHWVFPRPGR